MDFLNPENLDSTRIMQPTSSTFSAGRMVTFSDHTDPLKVAVADEVFPYAILREDVVVPDSGDTIPTFKDTILGLKRNQSEAGLPCNLVKFKINRLIDTDAIDSTITNLITPTDPNGTGLVSKSGLWHLPDSTNTAPIVGRMYSNKLGAPEAFNLPDFPNGYITIRLVKE
jgi:hypothetical protein